MVCAAIWNRLLDINQYSPIFKHFILCMLHTLISIIEWYLSIFFLWIQWCFRINITYTRRVMTYELYRLLKEPITPKWNLWRIQFNSRKINKSIKIPYGFQYFPSENSHHITENKLMGKYGWKERKTKECNAPLRS